MPALTHHQVMLVVAVGTAAVAVLEEVVEDFR